VLLIGFMYRMVSVYRLTGKRRRQSERQQ
jgi:hypothetical protein